VLFGTDMKSVIGAAMPGEDNFYISFMVPGIIALTAMSGAINGGLVLLQERILGIVKEYFVATISHMSVLMANALSTVTKSLIQALIIIAVGALMGAQFSSNLLGWLGGVLLIGGFGLGFAGIGLAVASKTNSPGGYHMLIFMLTLPLLFVSNSLYPLASLPTWMRVIAQGNPMSYVVDGLRQTIFQSSTTGSDFALWLCFLVVALFAVFGMLLAYFSFRKSMK